MPHFIGHHAKPLNAYVDLHAARLHRIMSDVLSRLVAEHREKERQKYVQDRGADLWLCRPAIRSGR